jgi:ABC-type multidrug transport system fused ATPase/permease subunit
VPQEAPAIIEKSRPPAYWPSSDGELVVDDLTVRYAPSLPAVLRNLSFTVKPSEKIGVVRLLFSHQTINPTYMRYV